MWLRHGDAVHHAMGSGLLPTIGRVARNIVFMRKTDPPLLSIMRLRCAARMILCAFRVVGEPGGLSLLCCPDNATLKVNVAHRPRDSRSGLARLRAVATRRSLPAEALPLRRWRESASGGPQVRQIWWIVRAGQRRTARRTTRRSQRSLSLWKRTEIQALLRRKPKLTTTEPF
jgi:hypothetical protein